MRRWGQFIGFLALLVFLIPALPAQEEKKDADKAAEKKDAAKTDAEKKDPEKKDAEKKTEAKKDAEKKAEKKEVEKVEYGTVLPPTKLVRIADNSAREFAVEMQEIDPERVVQLKIWMMQQQVQMAQQRDPRAAAQQRLQYQVQLAQKQAREIYKPVAKEMRAVENIKVRTMFLPVQFDDNGNPKKWTQKDIRAFKGNSTLPGYPAELDALKIGQVVQCYLAKQQPKSVAKGPALKKKFEDEEEAAAGETRPEVVMIVVLQEAQPQR